MINNQAYRSQFTQSEEAVNPDGKNFPDGISLRGQTQLWIYLLPVVGIVPALWTLQRSAQLKNDVTVQSDRFELRQRQKISRLSINLALVWLSCYCLLSFGAAGVSGVESFRLLYTNALITTGYFLACTFLMFRLNKKSLLVSNSLDQTKQPK